MNTYIPENYHNLLSVYDTQKAIGLLKRLFEDQLAANLNLFAVSGKVEAYGAPSVWVLPRERSLHRHERHPAG